jgi:hypothetical protein
LLTKRQFVNTVDPAVDLFDGTAVRNLALAFAELATIVLHGGGWH